MEGKAIRIIDSHTHVALSWFEPTQSLVNQMDAYGVAASVLIQMNGQFDNGYLFESVRRFPGRFAPVVLVDHRRADAADQLENLARLGASGVRLQVTARSAGDDELSIWRAAAGLGLTISCGGLSTDFASDAFADLVAAVPRARIVIEHLGGGNHPDSDPVPPERRARIFSLSRFSNVYIKFHGLGEFARRELPVRGEFPFQRPLPSTLSDALVAFGPERMMWGSDYPPVSAREGYGNALQLPLAELAAAGQTACETMFGGLAERLFPVR